MCHFLFIVLNVIIIATISSSYMNRSIPRHRTIFIHIVQPQDDIYILLYSHRMIFIHYCTATGRYLYIIVQPQDDIYILLYSQRPIFMGLYSNEMRIISMMRRIEVIYKLTSNIKEI